MVKISPLMIAPHASFAGLSWHLPPLVMFRADPEGLPSDAGRANAPAACRKNRFEGFPAAAPERAEPMAKVTLVNFWAQLVPACRAEAPQFAGYASPGALSTSGSISRPRCGRVINLRRLATRSRRCV